MNILITGAKGFVGKNFVCALNNLGKEKNVQRKELVDEIYEYDVDSTLEELEEYCQKADFVFNLAGVMRPHNQDAHMKENFGFASILLETLKKYNNKCPVMLASSVQASLVGRYDNEYGRSKKAGEDLFFRYGEETGAQVLVYRFTNLFGKWGKPNYNSVVSTFCNNIANDIPIQINDPTAELTLLYIDDLIENLIAAIEGKVIKCDYDGLEAIESENGKFCYVRNTHKVTLQQLVDLLHIFKAQSQTLVIPEIPKGSFAKKLYSTYLSYLPQSAVAFDLKTNEDERGSFTELLKTVNCGQVSVNISKPGVTKGQHWHNTKWEFFIVVSGHGLIQQRKIGTDEVLNFEVSGEKMQAVHMLPGYTHNIINLSSTENLVTVMWANEQFDPNKPDTFFEEV